LEIIVAKPTSGKAYAQPVGEWQIPGGVQTIGRARPSLWAAQFTPILVIDNLFLPRYRY
jgi:hypothetical protein